MNVTEVKLYKSKPGSMVKAFGKATVDNKLCLDIIVMDKENGNGPWASFPNGKTGKDGKWYVPVYWIDKEDDSAFKSKVIEAYNAQLNDGFTQPKTTTSTDESTPALGGDDMPF